jgi:hypothetical protein
MIWVKQLKTTVFLAIASILFFTSCTKEDKKFSKFKNEVSDFEERYKTQYESGDELVKELIRTELSIYDSYLFNFKKNYPELKDKSEKQIEPTLGGIGLKIFEYDSNKITQKTKSIPKWQGDTPPTLDSKFYIIIYGTCFETLINSADSTIRTSLDEKKRTYNFSFSDNTLTLKDGPSTSKIFLIKKLKVLDMELIAAKSPEFDRYMYITTSEELANIWCTLGKNKL